MKLDFHRMGQKLFFVTFAVEERRPVLSRLVDEKSRPQLLPMGEVVRKNPEVAHAFRRNCLAMNDLAAALCAAANTGATS